MSNIRTRYACIVHTKDSTDSLGEFESVEQAEKAGKDWLTQCFVESFEKRTSSSYEIQEVESLVSPVIDGHQIEVTLTHEGIRIKTTAPGSIGETVGDNTVLFSLIIDGIMPNRYLTDKLK